jgi:hypothetical protein
MGDDTELAPPPEGHPMSTQGNLSDASWREYQYARLKESFRERFGNAEYLEGVGEGEATCSEMADEVHSGDEVVDREIPEMEQRKDVSPGSASGDGPS